MKFPKKFIELKSSILSKRDAFFILLLTCLIFYTGFTGEAKSQSLLQKFDVTYLKRDSKTKNYSPFFKDTVIKKTSSDSLKKKNVKFVMTKSPWKAVVLSAILPGLGQFYNESYWKLPIIAAIGGSLGYYFFYNNSKFLDYRDLYANSLTPQNPFGDDRYKRLRESYRDARDQNLLYFAMFYLVNLADAYVDAHLYDFNVDKQINIGLFKKNSLVNLNIKF